MSALIELDTSTGLPQPFKISKKIQFKGSSSFTIHTIANTNICVPVFLICLYFLSVRISDLSVCVCVCMCVCVCVCHY